MSLSDFQAVICHGNWKDHCCYLAGEVCPYLEVDTVPGRRFACGLYRVHQDWDKVHTDPRYLANVRSVWDTVTQADGSPFPDCGDWPQKTAVPNRCCHNPDVKAELDPEPFPKRAVEIEQRKGVLTV